MVLIINIRNTAISVILFDRK